MDTKTKEIQVGLAVIVSVAVLISGMLWFKNVSISRGMSTYQADFSSVEGLQLRDRVQVRGIRVGQVEDFEILDGFVRVTLSIDETVALAEDAQISLGTKGIVGEIIVDIDPGRGARVAPGHVFQGRAVASIAAMTDAAGTALETMTQVAGKLDTLLTEIQREGRVVETLGAAREAVQRIDTLVAVNGEQLGRTLENLEGASSDLAALLESGRIDTTLADASGAMARADSLMTNFAVASERLTSILVKLDEGDGAAARLLNDPDLYVRADSTLTSVQRLTDAMRRNPKRFFKVNLVDF